MKWQEAQELYPDKWLVFEALESQLEGVDVKLGEIAVLAATGEGREIMRLSGQWQRKLQNREIFFAHTSQKIPPLKDYRHLSPARYYVPNLNEKIKVEIIKTDAAKEGCHAGSNVAA